MKMVGNIKLPLEGTVKHRGTDQDALDLLFDLKVTGMNRTLQLLNTVGEPALLIVKCNYLDGIIALIMFIPPDMWKDFKGQKYQVYLSPSLPLMVHYWQDRRMRTHDMNEVHMITKIMAYCENFLSTQKTSNTLR